MNVLNKVSQQTFHNEISVCLLQYLFQQFIIFKCANGIIRKKINSLYSQSMWSKQISTINVHKNSSISVLGIMCTLKTHIVLEHVS